MCNLSPTPHPCGKCAFYRQSVWEPVGERNVAALAHQFKRKDLAQGRALWEQNSMSVGVTCISNGLVALRRLHSDGGSTLLRLAYPGEVIGIRSFLTGRDHQTEAIALLPSRVCVVPRNRASRIVKMNPEVMWRLAIRCIDEIDRNQERIVAATRMSNMEQLAALLQRLMDAHGEKLGDRRSMRLPLLRSELAELIGVQPETLSRLLGRLSQDGRISVSGREIVMPVADARRENTGPSRV